ncbi:MAG: hypothetical protein WCA07_03110 [Gloeobacterales cyanobacterium]
MTEIQKVTLGLFITAIFSVWFAFAFTHDLLPQIGNQAASISHIIR